MYYFVSDIHLGGDSKEKSRATEKLFIEWLNRVEADAEIIFLCGDIFDFWFEYKRVVPKGFVRSLAKIAQLSDNGVRVCFMAGNHDMWVRDYFTEECGVEIYTSPQYFEIGGKRIFVAHGDNLNIKQDPILKIMNSTFRSKWIRWIFSRVVHPDLALKFGQWWSSSSRKKHCGATQEHRGVVHLSEYAERLQAQNPADLYIFGHIHFAKHDIRDKFQIVMMNDWSHDPHYIAIDNKGEAQLKKVIE